VSFFSRLYDQVMLKSSHPKAPAYLSGLSFSESSFFPIPPDVMLMPMCLAKPERALYFAWLTTLFSVLGGIVGYAIGYFAMDLITPTIQSMGYLPKLEMAQAFFDEYGVWIVFIAGFSPIPYKVFTISAGASSMAFLPFVIASIIGRGARFYLVALLMKYGGHKIEPYIKKWVDWLGWTTVGLIAAYILYKTL
jgi:membrane protein YqaA with SNARE-associated domain